MAALFVGGSPGGRGRSHRCRSGDRRGRELPDPVEVGSDDRLIDSDIALEPTDVLLLFGLHERDDYAVPAGTGRPTRAVDVGLVVLGWVVVHHRGDALDVDAPGSDVGGHQGVHPAVHEVGQGAGPLVLATPAVDGSSPYLCPCQLLGEAVGSVAGAAEDDGRPGGVDGLSGQADPVMAVDGPEHVGGRRYVRRIIAHLVVDGIVLVVPGQLGDVAVQRG